MRSTPQLMVQRTNKSSGESRRCLSAFSCSSRASLTVYRAPHAPQSSGSSFASNQSVAITDITTSFQRVLNRALARSSDALDSVLKAESKASNLCAENQLSVHVRNHSEVSIRRPSVREPDLPTSMRLNPVHSSPQQRSIQTKMVASGSARNRAQEIASNPSNCNSSAGQFTFGSMLITPYSPYGSFSCDSDTSQQCPLVKPKQLP